jgi:hypothetical protein
MTASSDDCPLVFQTFKSLREASSDWLCVKGQVFNVTYLNEEGIDAGGAYDCFRCSLGTGMPRVYLFW